MKKSIYYISKMDCPTEENLIRMKLDSIPSIKHMDFDLQNRKIYIYHTENNDLIDSSLLELNIGAQKLTVEDTDDVEFDADTNQRNILWMVLFINFLFFIIEIVTGLLSKSLGLVADSLDMLADSFVYAISLLAVGSTQIRKKFVAKIAGYFQILLALIGFIEVIRRFLDQEGIPNFTTMIIVSIFALIANAICMILLQKTKNKNDAHIRASMIFTSNDVIINLGVILAGISVCMLNSNLPDLLIGAIVFLIVINGAFRILKLSK